MERRSITDEKNDEKKNHKDFQLLSPNSVVYGIYYISILLVFKHLTEAGEQYYGTSNTIHTNTIYLG